jgi:segregation and condensation protein A
MDKMLNYTSMEDTAYKIKLPVFEGPLDLLLHLIREHKMDIYDIQISLITEQYLEYIEMMKELNLEIAGEFLVMASTLIHIKSRMLLPIEETADTDEPEDPRLELVMKLLEYKSFKDAALGLQERQDECARILPRVPLPEEGEKDEEPDLSLFDLNLFDLLSAFNKLLEKAPPETRTITREILTVKDKMNFIIETMKTNKALEFQKLFKYDESFSALLVTFIALLELIKLGLAKCYQKDTFNPIWIINPEAEVNIESLQGHAGDSLQLVKREHKRTDSGIIKEIVSKSREESTRAHAEEEARLAPDEPARYKCLIKLPDSRLGIPYNIGCLHSLPARIVFYRKPKGFMQ